MSENKRNDRYRQGHNLGRASSASPGLYIHIPFCKKKCAYCDFYSIAATDDKTSKYVSVLKTHLTEAADLVHSGVSSIYFGGGTPAMLGARHLCDLLKLIQKKYTVAAGAEITIELNPESTDWKLLRSLRKTGFNRISFGVQSAVEEELKLLGRLHSFDEAKQAVLLARDEGFINISIDLMYGIEQQTTDSFAYSLREILELAPEHISCYGLKVEENTPLWARRELADLPDDDAQADFYTMACEMLKEAGYTHYEISNFAKPGYESRHNMKYWKLEPYLGFGPAAHSDFGGRRYSYVRSLDAYIKGIEENGYVIDEMEEISPDKRSAEYLMLRLRLKEGVDPGEYVRRFSLPFEPIESKLREYEKMGYARFDGRWSLTEKGFLLSNTIIASIL